MSILIYENNDVDIRIYPPPLIFPHTAQSEFFAVQIVWSRISMPRGSSIVDLSLPGYCAAHWEDSENECK